MTPFIHRRGGDCNHTCCLKIQNLSVRYGAEEALSGVNLHMHCGQIVALIGPNGAGKSTLIHAILGQQAYTGSITFHGPDGREQKLRIGYVPQSPNFAKGDPMSLIDRRVGALSGGELQRVLLALALEPMPNMLILDEPLSGVDVEGMALLMDMLDGIRKKFDLSILMTTHDFSMLEKYADRVVLLRERVLCEGTPEQVLSSDAFAEVFHMRGGKAQ